MSRLVHDPTPRPVILREAHPSIKPDKVRRCTLLQGDVIDRLRELPAESVHCCITSPPYFGLRCYGVDGQIGQEETPQEHIRVIVQVFEEVRRVLRKDGTLWLNYGDCYATSANGRSAADVKALGGDDRTFRDKPYSTVGNGFKPKDLMMMPHRIAIALQEAGWWVRSDIVWSKPNPMPESIADRPTKSHSMFSCWPVPSGTTTTPRQSASPQPRRVRNYLPSAHAPMLATPDTSMTAAARRMDMTNRRK